MDLSNQSDSNTNEQDSPTDAEMQINDSAIRNRFSI